MVVSLYFLAQKAFMPRKKKQPNEAALLVPDSTLSLGYWLDKARSEIPAESYAGLSLISHVDVHTFYRKVIGKGGVSHILTGVGKKGTTSAISFKT